MSVTQELVEFAVDTRYEDLPEDVVEVVRLAHTNIIGTCLGGYQTRIGRLHVDIAKEHGGGREQALIIGDGSRVSIPFAAYANGNLGFALDYEDMIYYILHPGYITVAAALALGEQTGASGRDVIAAVALGFEVAGRIGVAMQPTAERGSQVWGEQYHPFAAAVTAGRLLGLDAAQMNSAFGVAGTYAPVPSVFKYFGVVEESRPMREGKLGWGWQAMAGVMAAISAHKGFGGGHGILDGERGFWIMAGSDRCDFERMTAGLGSQWVTRDTEYKIHPSIGWNHPAFQATRELVAEHEVQPEAVEAVRITSFMANQIDDRAPAGAVDAMFSLPYTVCTTILREPLGPSLYEEEKLRDPRLRRLLSLTTCEHDREADTLLFDEQRLRQRVAIELAGGRRLERAIEFPRDKPAYGKAEIEAKLDALAAGVLPAAQIEAIKRACETLDQAPNLDALLALLS